MDAAGAFAFLDERIRYGMRPGTERIAALVESLDHPQRSYPVVHVAGTNGKYSVVRMCEVLLAHLGLTVGTYTSPHLESVLERATVGGEQMTEADLARVVGYLEPYVEAVESRLGDQLTYMELVTAVAFEWLFDAAVHVGVIEAGLGGEYDATNVVEARVGVLTNVSPDHLKQFGDLRKAAWEKAGIIKPGSVLVTGIDDDDLFAIVTERAAERGAASVARLGRDVAVTDRRVGVGGQLVSIQGLHATYDELPLPLHGEHQAANLALALAATEAFVGEAIDHDAVVAALAALDLPARVEIAGRRPLVLIDGGHNVAASAAVKETVTQAFAYANLTMVVAMFEDKQIEEVLDQWSDGTVARFHVSAPAGARAADPTRLRTALETSGVDAADIDVFDSVGAALAAAIAGASEGDAVLVFGNMHAAGEARAWLRERAAQGQA